MWLSTQFRACGYFSSRRTIKRVQRTAERALPNTCPFLYVYPLCECLDSQIIQDVKDSESERISADQGSSGQLPTSPPQGDAAQARESTLQAVFELQMGMLWLAQQAMRDLLGRFELHPPHLMILHLLGGRHPGQVSPHEGGLSMSDFVRGMDIPPASATAMIDRMATQGLVERGPSEQDRRVVLVKLTPRGLTVLDEVTSYWQQVQRDAFTVLSDEQLASHLALMKRLQEGYQQRYPETLPAAPAQELP